MEVEKEVIIPRNASVTSSGPFTVTSKATHTSQSGMLRRSRQEGLKFEASLGYTVRSSLKKNPEVDQTRKPLFSLPPYFWGVPR